MERIWHHNKPAKRGPPTKTHGPGKEGINQRGNKETKDIPQRRLEYLSIGPLEAVELGFTEEWPEKKPLLKTCWGSGAVLRHFEKNMCPFLTASYTNSEARICILLTHSDRKHSEFSKTV